MDRRLTDAQLQRLVAEVQRLSDRHRSELDAVEVQDILQQLDLSPEFLGDALVQLKRQDALLVQQRRRRWLIAGVAGVVALGLVRSQGKLPPVNLAALYGYGCFSYVPTPLTPVQEVMVLPAGIAQTWEGDGAGQLLTPTHHSLVNWRESPTQLEDEATAIATAPSCQAASSNGASGPQPTRQVEATCNG